MMKLRLFRLLTAALALAALSSSLRAQENLPAGPSNYDEDLQLFSPFEIDLDNMADKQWSGYFFDYNKLFWAYTGKRTTIGSPNVSEMINGVAVQGQFAEVIYQQNPQDLGTSPAPYLVQNTLTN